MYVFFHYDKYNSLEEGSDELIFEKACSGTGSVPGGS